MRGTRIARSTAFFGIFALAVAGCSTDNGDTDTTPSDEPTVAAGDYTTREVSDGTTDFVVVDNPDGTTLSYSAEGGVTLLEEEIDGSTYAFKDMNGNGELDTWEDWREDSEVRATELAA